MQTDHERFERAIFKRFIETGALPSKQYSTPYLTHLLAYYNLHPAGPPEIWLPDARGFVESNWATSPFARVWIMDAADSRILLDLLRNPRA
jgi:hypothetical protein